MTAFEGGMINGVGKLVPDEPPPVRVIDRYVDVLFRNTKNTPDTRAPEGSTSKLHALLVIK